MTQDEYFNQTLYFSESAQELIEIRSMPFQHAFNAYKRLLSVDGFIGSKLSGAFVLYLYPSRDDLEKLFYEYGQASHVHHGGKHTAQVRSKMRRAGKRMGLKIETVKSGPYIHAGVVHRVSVRGQRV